MRRSSTFLAALLLLIGCTKAPSVDVEVANSLDEALDGYVVELPYATLIERLGTDQMVVVDADGIELPSQVTYDSLLVFQADLSAGTNKFTVKPGIPATYPAKAVGRFYPERLDDLGWENDKMGFRAYGPGSQAKGEHLYGYDIFLKRDTAGPVLEMFYASDHNPANWARVDSLRRAGRIDEASEFIKEFSYHVDHGYGMDCYAVGPTLGAATAALMDGDRIVYPWCYRVGEILDNGPVRFTARLVFNPAIVGNDTVIEVRTIRLDAGSHFNRVDVSYLDLTAPRDIVTGIVIHDTEENASYDANTITYIDPTQGDDNGSIFISALTAEPAKSSGIYTPAAAGELSHVIATHTIAPGEEFTYYWGFGWDRSDTPTLDAWRETLAREQRLIAKRPIVNIR